MKFSKREKIFTGLFLVVLSFAFFANAVPVRASVPEFIITVKAYQLHTEDKIYDPAPVGEFRFQCSFESDKSPKYTSSTWSLSTYSTRTYTESLHSEAMDGSDYVYFELYEYDPWPGASDTVVHWQSVRVSSMAWGYSYHTFYDVDEEDSGLYCKFQVYKVDNPYH